MFRNYLVTSLRSLGRSRVNTAINLAGLAIALGACLLTLIYVRYETGYDRWIPDAADVYQVQTLASGEDAGSEIRSQLTGYPTAAALESGFPQIENAVFVLPGRPVFVQKGTASSTEAYFYVEEDLFKVLDLPLVAGSHAALKVNSVILSQSEARRRFGNDDIVGKSISLISKGVTTDYPIVGVMRDLPKDSHLRVNAIIRVDLPSYLAKEQVLLGCWACPAGYVYAKLRSGSDASAIQAGLPAWEKRNIPDEDADGTRINAGDRQDWRLVNVADVHLGRGQAGAMSPGNDQRSIATFGAIALLILAMACVNFTNLATARASLRAREIAVRKVLGARRWHLVNQFLVESVVLVAAAMLLGLAAVSLVLPYLAHFLDADLRLQYFGDGGIALPVVALVLIVGIAGGMYPALFLSRFRPAEVLKANKSSAEMAGSGRLRILLVVAQFAISISLIICTLVIYAQTRHARTVDPGFRRDHIMQVDGLNRYQLVNSGDRIVEAMRRIPDVEAVGRSTVAVATDGRNPLQVVKAGSSTPTTIDVHGVDPGLDKAMGLELLAGRWFDEHRPMDDSTLSFPLDAEQQRDLVRRGANVVVNEAAVRALGFARPSDALGKQLRAGFVEPQYGLVPVTVIGVVKDSRFQSVKQAIEPIMFQSTSTGHQFLIVRYRGSPADVRARLEQTWRGITTEVPFDARFSEEASAELYDGEEARAEIFATSSVLAVVIACLGLFGLSAFAVERRTKEIGIRKVFGARVRDIVGLMAWQFLKPVIVANVIAWPLAWWLMRDWLNGFDDRIPLQPGPFVLAGAIALAIALATVSGHAIKVARSNPVTALRYE